MAKQGWRTISRPDSLISRVLKAKYFPRTDFLNSNLGTYPSYVWRSIWATEGVLQKGLCWRVGFGDTISVADDPWIPDNINFKLSDYGVSVQNLKVANLIADNRTWKKEVIDNTFSEADACNILRIPLADEGHADCLVWGSESSGEFSVRSSYRILQNNFQESTAYALQPMLKIFAKASGVYIFQQK